MFYLQPLTFKRKIIFLTVGFGLFLYLLITLFTQQAAEDILLQNAVGEERKVERSVHPDSVKRVNLIQKIQSLVPGNEIGSNQSHPSSLLLNNSLVHFPEYNENFYNVKNIQENKWKQWLHLNQFVSVGKYYHQCDDGIQIGEFILTPNKSANHGILLKSFINVTWSEPILSGKLHLDVSFNGIRFLKYNFEMCAKIRKFLKCPLSKGFHKIEVSFGLPRFLLKGTYQVKAWSDDSKGRTVACLVSNIII